MRACNRGVLPPLPLPPCLSLVGSHSTPLLPLSAVILACRSISRGEALKQQLEAEAQERGQPQPQLEVRQRGGGAVVGSWHMQLVSPSVKKGSCSRCLCSAQC